MFCKFSVVLFGVALVLFGESEGQKNSRTGNSQGGKCPYSLIDLKSLSTPVRSQTSILGFFKDKIKNVLGFLWPGDSSMDKVNIIAADAVKYETCQSGPTETSNCDPSSPYRELDGTCNNLDNPKWGVADECQIRMLPPMYEGENGYRLSVSGKEPLPGPRELSYNILPVADRPIPELTSMSVLIGQFLTHDIMLTPQPSRNIRRCCPYNATNQARPECSPIFVPKDDPYYSRHNITCLPFERSIECSTCGDSGAVSKIIRVTAVIDLSTVYGTSKELNDLLREKDGTGKLKTDSSDGQGDLLLKNVGDFSNFCTPKILDKCFLVGDDRVDQHAGLTSLHTIFMREHNRLAEELKQLNPKWEEEKLFQETRKIMGGKWQNIAFNEYLPDTLGPRHMNHFGLWLDRPYRYNASLRPSTFLEVSTAGFRLHSQVTRLTGLSGLRFFDTYRNPDLVREGCIDGLLEGACGVTSQAFDRYFEEDVDGMFVKLPGDKHGLDSSSIDIKRGRDHGLPTYAQTVKFLTAGQTDVRSFDDLKRFMTADNIKLLRANYESVHDVDLWLGLQLEKHAPGSILGFNSATLSALQFHHIKYGDRFYFERRGKGAAFTPAQIASLRKSSLAQILCDNSNLKAIQKYPLRMPSRENPIVDCTEIAKMDLTPWKSV